MKYVVFIATIVIATVTYFRYSDSTKPTPAQVTYSQGVFAQSAEELDSKCNSYLEKYPTSSEKSLDDFKRFVKIVHEVKLDGTSFIGKGWSKNNQDIFGITLSGNVVVDNRYSFSAECHVRSNGIASVFIDSKPITYIEQAQ